MTAEPPTTALEDAIEAATAGRLGRDEFLDVLAGSEIVPALTPEGDLWIFTWNDRPHAALFSSAARSAALEGARAGSPVAGRVVARGWPSELWVALNPGTGNGLVLPPDVMRSLAEAHPEPLEPGTSVAVGAPAHAVPDAVRSAVAAALTRPGVAHGYLFELWDARHGARLVAGAELDPDVDPDRVLPAAASDIAARLPNDQRPDLLPLDQDLVRAVRYHVDPLPTV